jgi:KDEL-tailed cysteine endopeptidase
MFKTLAVTAFASAALAANTSPRETYEAAFAEHVQNFGLKFANGAEFVARLQIFADNMDTINAHNAGTASYKMGVNQFSHMTLTEFQQATHSGGFRPPSLRKGSNKVHTNADVSALPASVDWSTTGAVTPVKNQGSCGSCWSFSATGGMEGAYFVKTGAAVSFSEQQFVSCDDVDLACNGGWMDDAFAWAKGNGGICSEADYPYTSGSGTVAACKTSCAKIANSAPSGFVDVVVGNVNALMTAVAQQPVSIAIQANQVAFQTYKSGVLTGTCGQRLDHGVLAVGYGTWTDGTPYWKVKNSWGSGWGMDGYILIERSDADLCGVLDASSFPTY